MGPGAPPRFVNPEAGDFRLRAGSPALDRGAPIPEVPQDFERRPRGSPPDIGPFER